MSCQPLGGDHHGVAGAVAAAGVGSESGGGQKTGKQGNRKAMGIHARSLQVSDVTAIVLENRGVGGLRFGRSRTVLVLLRLLRRTFVPRQEKGCGHGFPPTTAFHTILSDDVVVNWFGPTSAGGARGTVWRRRPADRGACAC